MTLWRCILRFLGIRPTFGKRKAAKVITNMYPIRK